MDRKTFIETLQRALYGKIDDVSLAEHIRYYEDYISQEMRAGKTEREVMEELGDPRLIARTILETSGRQGNPAEYTVEEDGNPAPSPKIHVHRYEGWKATLVTFLIFAAVLLLLILVFRVVIALLPFLIVVGLILWLLRMYRK